MEQVDVAVVGGGPAGSSAAAAAAGEGADAVLIEQGVPRADRENLGPDSTDAAGMLDYWLDIMGEDPTEWPDDVVLRVLDRAEFIGPSESVTLDDTGIDATYPEFGFTFHRARFDDFLRGRAEDAGADYRVGTGVQSVETDLNGPTHTVTRKDGSQLEAEHVILADGPQRRVTMPALDQFTPGDRSISEVLSPRHANHIAYQEYREFPEELVEPESIKFWWGWMPGETAYPWVFPNDGRLQRVGLTMPIGVDLDAVADRDGYRLVHPDDDTVPGGGTYVRRLLEELYGDEYDIESDFPLVEDAGKDGGTETYPISSTQPIDSPTAANVAVVGGAMGATSAFHEGGDHVAVRTGKLAGRLAARGRLDRYNDAWKRAVGEEVRRNVAIADLVAEYGPADWDRTFRATRRLTERDGPLMGWSPTAGVTGLRLVAGYKRRKYRFRGGRIVQFRESDYAV
jgi:electron-transferring-flavoprotein dehydrogenase